MALDAFQVGYFITQVGLSAVSFGVAQADVEAVGMSLNNLFRVQVRNLYRHRVRGCRRSALRYDDAPIVLFCRRFAGGF